MEDTSKKKKSTTKNSKSKNNYDPKWKAKKKGNVAPKKEVKKTEPKKKVESPSKAISKKEGKTVNKDKIIHKYNIEKTSVIQIPDEETLNKIYNEMHEKENISDETVSVSTGRHYSYTSRLCTLIAMILLFLFLCIMFLFKAVDYKLGGSVTYSEYTNDNYFVCYGETIDVNKCLPRDLEYSALETSNIYVTFNYEAMFSRKVKFDTNYSVISKLKIYDKKDKSKILFSSEDILIDKTSFNIDSTKIAFSTDVCLDFVKYKDYAKNIMSNMSGSLESELELSLLLESDDVSRKVSYVTIPLSADEFVLSSYNLDNENQLIINNNKNRIVDPFYLFMSIICFLMDILLFSYLINFIYLANHTDNSYNTLLKEILDDYDGVIVNATSAYVIPEGMQVVEVESFEELLDARDTLEKPIVYERINNIKSKFYVEDDKTVFVFTMKDEG